MYELRVAKHGKENEYTIWAGKSYAIELQEANRRKEARELLTKLLATSKQVLGSQHNVTKEVELDLEQVVEHEDSDSSDNVMDVDDDSSSTNEVNINIPTHYTVTFLCKLFIYVFIYLLIYLNHTII